MANSDRISEVYKGEIWAESTQQVARDRIHWLVGQATGDVLDIGCSQGIASILCARRGLTSSASTSRPTASSTRSPNARSEPEDVRDAARLPPRRRHRARLRRRLVRHGHHGRDRRALRGRLSAAGRGRARAAPGGRLALTTPFGLSRHHDHYATFYVDSLVRLLAPYFTVESLDIVDRYLRVCARPGAMADPDRLIVESQPLMERALVAIQERPADEQGPKMRRYDVAIARYEQVNARMKNLEARLAHAVLPHGLRDLAAQVGQEPQVVAARRGAVERQAPRARRCGCPRTSPPRSRPRRAWRSPSRRRRRARPTCRATTRRSPSPRSPSPTGRWRATSRSRSSWTTSPRRLPVRVGADRVRARGLAGGLRARAARAAVRASRPGTATRAAGATR